MDKKWTHVLFAVGAILLAWILSKTGEWVWGYFGKPNGMLVGAGATLIAGVVAYVCWRNEELFNLASEVTGELAKVSWPSRQETFNSTIVVIVTTIISSIILGVFDGVWSWFTRLIYG
jgi:preprotein translocase subunit SecE